MGPPSEGQPLGEGRSRGGGRTPYEEGRRFQTDRDVSMQDEQLQAPNGPFTSDNKRTRSPANGTPRPDREREGGAHKTSGERTRSRPRRTGSGQLRICKKCGEPLTGQFVRALGGTFHLDCFRCRDCNEIVASKFFPVDEENGEGQYPLCEFDYFRRLDLICHKCNGALRGSYITALDRKYHIDHFTCSVCPTVFGAQDSYYEHEGQVYCHYHYSTQFAQRCNGCQTAILKQFVEIFRNNQNQHWHPECYMIHKFWNVRLASSEQVRNEIQEAGGTTDEQQRNAVRDEEERMEEKVYRIWSVLSTFEESSAACISDMLLHVSNGSTAEGVIYAKRFISHVEILFRSIDVLDENMTSVGSKGLSYGREAKLLCKKVVAFFALLSKNHEKNFDGGVRKLGVTQELLALVTGLAHYLKLLIRICLQGALKSEREQNSSQGLHHFLECLGNMDALRDEDKSLEALTGTSGLGAAGSDECQQCKKPIEEACALFGEKRWHRACLKCSHCQRDMKTDLQDVRWNERTNLLFCNDCQDRAVGGAVSGFEPVTKLEQYVFLLRVALARMLENFRKNGTLPHTSDDPHLNGYNSSEGHRLPSEQDPPHLRSNSRSKSFGGMGEEDPAPSSYESTLNDVRRLRSTRMDKHLSSTIRKARTSRIMDRPEGRSARPGSAGADGSDARRPDFQIVEDRDVSGDTATDLMTGRTNGLTLDDIPALAKARQTVEQRPNAYKHARHELFQTSATEEPKLVNGHQRSMSTGDPLDLAGLSNAGPPAQRREAGKKYFSELSPLEYFVVRHVAVIAMQPMLEGHFTMEELLNLIETRKPTFWTKMGINFGPKNEGGKKGGKKKGVFGVPLEVILDRDGADSTDGIGPGALRIPAIVDDAITTMRKMDLSVEGVFRKNGNIKRLNDTMAAIDKEGCDSVDLSKENVVQVAALLKKYLRELPDPLLTFKLHRLYIASQKVADEDKRRRILHLTCCLLPKAHRDCLEILCSFFNWVATFHQVDEESGSKMDLHNIATVIAPNILFTNAKTPVDDNFLAIEVVHTLIECNEQLCEIPEDLQSILADQTLFNNSSEITTKEILKRYGDLGSNGGPKHQVETFESNQGGRTNDRPLAPVVTRVDADPTQAYAWQKESSVRHVQEPSAPYASAQNQNTPPQQWQNDLDAPSPYSHRNGNGTPDSQEPRAYRNSGWGRPQNGSGSVTTGAT